MHDVAAIVLAAGMSRRMGPENTLLMPLEGVPVVVRVVQSCAAVSPLPVTVVLGHEAARVGTALRGISCNTVFNPDFADGQMTSAGVGLTHAPAAGNYLMALGPQITCANFWRPTSRAPMDALPCRFTRGSAAIRS